MEGYFTFPKSPKTGASPSDGLMAYQGHSFVDVIYPSVDMHSVYSTAPAYWA